MIMRFLKTKIGAALIVAVLLVAAAFIYKTWTNVGESKIGQQVQLIAAQSVKSSIQNGAYDWQSALDLLSTSTVNDVVQNINGTQNAAATSTDEKTTATDRFARELFTQYATAKQNGQTIDEATQNDIADSVLSNDYSDPEQQISVSDLKTVEDTSRTGAKTYGNALGKVLNIPVVKGDQELVILERVRDSGMSSADAKTLELIRARYEAMKKGLMAMTVPAGAADGHTDLVNGVDLLEGGVGGILTLTSDPVGALTKIKHYEDGINLVESGALKLKGYFSSKDVVFSSDESGYALTQ